jgi:hypothetical protein
MIPSIIGSITSVKAQWDKRFVPIYDGKRCLATDLGSIYRAACHKQLTKCS